MHRYRPQRAEYICIYSPKIGLYVDVIRKNFTESQKVGGNTSDDAKMDQKILLSAPMSMSEMDARMNYFSVEGYS